MHAGDFHACCFEKKLLVEPLPTQLRSYYEPEGCPVVECTLEYLNGSSELTSSSAFNDQTSPHAKVDIFTGTEHINVFLDAPLSLLKGHGAPLHADKPVMVFISPKRHWTSKVEGAPKFTAIASSLSCPVGSLEILSLTGAFLGLQL